MECKDCKYFLGYDDDGIMGCQNEVDGALDCPYRQDSKAQEKNGMITITLNEEFLEEFINSSVQNAITPLVKFNVEKLVKEAFDQQSGSLFQSVAGERLHEEIERLISDYMLSDITVGGGWREPARTLSKQDYLSELIQGQLNKRFNNDQVLKDCVNSSVSSQIAAFTRRVKEDINRGIEQQFNEATRKNLTDSIVSILMANDTYRRMEDNLKHIAGN